jgi:protein-tyrosine phosphatase
MTPPAAVAIGVSGQRPTRIPRSAVPLDTDDERHHGALPDSLSDVIDIHSHILPGVDDGPTGVDDAVAMARLAAEDGIRTVACTPHRGYGYDTTPGEVAAGIAALQPVLDAEGIDVRLVSGLEIAIDRAVRMDDDELYAATFGGTGRWLLIEMPFQGWPLDLPALLTGLEVRGHGAVLAHPERAESVQANPDRISDLVGRGALVQITAGSLTGENGARAERAAHQLLRARLVHIIASDMHHPVRRPPGIRDALDAAATSLRRPAEDLEWMVTSIPQAVVEGQDARPPRL